MGQYIPKPPPPFDNTQAVVEWLEQELEALSRALEGEDDLEWVRPLAVEPTRPRDGMIAFADGTNWDPGSGAGLYVYWDGDWRFMFGSDGGGVVTSVFGRTGDVVALVGDYDEFYAPHPALLLSGSTPEEVSWRIASGDQDDSGGFSRRRPSGDQQSGNDYRLVSGDQA